MWGRGLCLCSEERLVKGKLVDFRVLFICETLGLPSLLKLLSCLTRVERF